MKRFAQKKVIEHFKSSNEYKIRKGIVHTEDHMIIAFIQNIALPKDNIIEIGGGSGSFLDLVIERTNIENTYNMELVYDTYRKQANADISLIGGNALNVPFKDCSFNLVVIKNLLHHLVGRTRKESKYYARCAIEEMIRITKKDGYIIILDQYNKCRLCSFIIFYITLFFSVFGISFRSFGWNKNVIVSFLSPEETLNFLKDGDNIKIVKKIENKIYLSKKLKYSLLMSNIGRLVVIGKVQK